MDERYPPIAEHGLVGDLQTAALVSSRGVIDWFAAPRFDSPSIFAALLDAERGGYFQLAPEHSDISCKQLYYPDTAVLVTRFMSPEGVGEVIDYMPPARTGVATDRHTLVRVVRAVRGTVGFTLRCRPRFDYRRAEHELDVGPEGALFRAPGISAHPQSAFPLERDGRDVRGTVTLTAGETGSAVFTVCAPGGEAPPPLTVEGITAQSWDVVHFWKKWLRTSRYRGRWPELVHRSAITLKLLIHAPTGAMVAAATMGLPEQVGGGRNWDYRYTWIRDGSLSVRALLDLGFVEEATAFVHWLSPGCMNAKAPVGSRCRPCTGWTVTRTCPRRPWSTSRAIGARIPSVRATAPRTSSSWTSTARPSTHCPRGAKSSSSPPTRGGRRSPGRSTGSPAPGTGRTRASGRPAAAARTSHTAG